MKTWIGVLESAYAAPGMPTPPPPSPGQRPPPAKNPFGIWAILGLVGGLLVIVSMFLPWITLPGLAVIGIATGFWGILPFIFSIIGLVMCVLRKRAFYIVGGIMGILSFVFPLIIMMIISSIAAAFGKIEVGASLLGIGLYLAIIGGLLLTVGGFGGFAQTPKA